MSDYAGADTSAYFYPESDLADETIACLVTLQSQAGVKHQAIKAGMMTEENWDKGIADLYRTTKNDGAFCYTFFKGVGQK